VSTDDLFRDLIKALAPESGKTAEDLREEYLRACRRLDENPAEQQRIDDIADLLDAEEALYSQACAAYDRGDAGTAVPLLRQCAEAGTGEAAWLLAQLLEETGNIPEAMAWYQRARDDGDDRADERLAALRARPCPLATLAGSPQEDRAGQSAPPFFIVHKPRTWRDGAFRLAEAAIKPADPGSDFEGYCRELLSLIVLRAPGTGDASCRVLPSASVLPVFFSSPAHDQRAPVVDLWRAAGEVRNYLTHDTSWYSTRLAQKLARTLRAQEPALDTEWPGPGVMMICGPPGTGKTRLITELLSRLLDYEDYGRPCPANLSRYLATSGQRDARWPAREPVVADMMLPPSEVPACTPGTTVAQALELLVQSGTQALPVCEMTRVAGIVTLADLARHISGHQGVPPAAETVKALMRPATIVPPGTPLPAIAKAIADDGIIVVSGSGDQPDGYLTAESLLTQAPPGTSARPTAPDRPPLLIPGTGAVLLNRSL
jgi:CBS domain-containing protein